jgi:glycosyltransferase involved in cell wall biosynthesis
MTRCSVIVPTRNRRDSLSEALEALGDVHVPARWEVELIVVDNASADGSSAVAAKASIGDSAARVVFEPKQGVSRARNRGARVSSGDVLLFLDDDMRPPPQWLEGLVCPIAAGDAAATVSQFKAGPSRDRAWMTDEERGMFVTEHSVEAGHPFLVAGSMAITRAAFEFCGGFEERLGPGALCAGGEDLLMTYQLEAAGYPILCVPDVVTEHCFDKSKLSRGGIRERRIAGAMSDVWLAYHWWGRGDGLGGPKLFVLRVAAEGLRIRRAWAASLNLGRRPKR